MHSCYITTASGLSGQAIYICEEESGEFWVKNDEYATQVNFCPYCGEEAPIPAFEDYQNGAIQGS